jgi:serine protease inhibitor
MMRNASLSLLMSGLVSVSLLVVFCVAAGDEEAPLSKRNAEFAIAMYKNIAGGEDNVFFSPYSLSAALAMTYAGARGNTQTEMAEVLRLNGLGSVVHASFALLHSKMEAIGEEEEIELTSASSLWPQEGYPFLDKYLDLVTDYYGAAVTPVDYSEAPEAARAKINQWAEAETGGRIENLIPEGYLDRSSRLVLADALYFKGSWENRFDEAETVEAPFYKASGDTISVPMMTTTSDALYRYYSLAQVLMIPYAGRDVSLVVMLPHENVSLGDFEKMLGADEISRWIAGLDLKEVMVSLPRFKMKTFYDMGGTLARMGMKDAFDPGKADFRGMDGEAHSLFLSAVLQGSYIEVNEEGTEAAAATGITMKRISAGMPVEFRADRPFVFLIWQSDAESILFMGRVVDPRP